jgi:hypothetical protein
MLGIVQSLIQKQKADKNRNCGEKYKRPAYATGHKNVECGHFHRPHYAKGFCDKCRQKLIRDKRKVDDGYKNTECGHFEKPHLAKGLCVSCYQKKWRNENG